MPKIQIVFMWHCRKEKIGKSGELYKRFSKRNSTTVWFGISLICQYFHLSDRIDAQINI